MTLPISDLSPDIVIQYVCDLPTHLGRCVGICSFEGRIIVAMEHGQVLTIERNPYSGVSKAVEVKP